MVEGGQCKQVNSLSVSRGWFFSLVVSPLLFSMSVCESGEQTSPAPRGQQSAVLWAAEMKFISRIQAVCWSFILLTKDVYLLHELNLFNSSLLANKKSWNQSFFMLLDLISILCKLNTQFTVIWTEALSDFLFEKTKIYFSCCLHMILCVFSHF